MKKRCSIFLLFYCLLFTFMGCTNTYTTTPATENAAQTEQQNVYAPEYLIELPVPAENAADGQWMFEADRENIVINTYTTYYEEENAAGSFIFAFKGNQPGSVTLTFTYISQQSDIKPENSVTFTLTVNDDLTIEEAPVS